MKSTLVHHHNFLGIKPKLSELQLLKFSDGDELRIIDTVAPKWKQVAIALDFDGPKIETIEIGAHYQPGDACLKMFINWLSKGCNLTWNSLIQSLNAAKLTEISDFLSSKIEIVSFTPTINILSQNVPQYVHFNIQPEEAEDASALTTTLAADINGEAHVESSIATPDTINDKIKGSYYF